MRFSCPRFHSNGTCFAAVTLAVTLAGVAQAEPLASSFPLHEQRRRAAIASQIGANEQMRWLSGLPSRLYGGRPYSLESIYSGLAWSGYPAPWSTDVFEPWPRIAGDVYGRQFDGAWPQPSGHVVTPLGFNGYTYQPLYNSPLPPVPRSYLPPVHEVPYALPHQEQLRTPGPGNMGPLPGGEAPAEELPPPPADPELREF